MKKIILAVTLLTLALGFTVAQKNSTKQVEVTAQTLTSQPTGKPYVIDLTRGGTIYSLAAGIDYSRVRIHTAKGDKVIGDMVGRFSTDDKIFLGRIDDLRLKGFGQPTDTSQPPGLSEVRCDDASCGCAGRQDCSDLSRSGKCEDGTASCGTWQVGRWKGRWGCQCLKTFVH